MLPTFFQCTNTRVWLKATDAGLEDDHADRPAHHNSQVSPNKLRLQGSYTCWAVDFQDFKPNFHDQTEISV